MTIELPDKYKTCDWLWNYGSIGLTKEHIKRLNNVIGVLESLNEHTDAKYLKEIRDKLLENTPEPKTVKINTDLLKKIDEESNKIWKEINTGHDYVIIDSYEQFYGICVQIVETFLKSLNIEQTATEGAMVQIDRVLDVLDWAEEKGRISYSDWEDCYGIVASLKYRLKKEVQGDPSKEIQS